MKEQKQKFSFTTTVPLTECWYLPNYFATLIHLKLIGMSPQHTGMKERN